MYALLLFVQTLAAGATLAAIHRWFRVLLEGLGEAQAMQDGELILLLVAFLVGQAAYWVRLMSVRIPVSRHVVLGHVVSFLGKLGFIFGGALFSLAFLRHVPALAPEHYTLGLVIKGGVMVASIFSLFCYTLELERLGLALQSAPHIG